MARKLNWGIITTGWIARKFATDLRQSQTGRLVAVGARQHADADKFAADFGGVRAHGSYEALLADPEVEAVYIGTPHPWHAEWAIKAAAAGKHVLCEKPLTLRRADTERVIAAARRHGVLLMEAFMYRLHPQTRKLVELVRNGAIGELRLIRASFNVLADFNPEHRMFKKALGGGAILGGLVLTSIAVFVIDREFAKAAVFAVIGAGFTFFGFMHGEAIGFAQSPVVALAYLGVAGVMFGCAKYASATPKALETHAPHGAVGQLAT